MAASVRTIVYVSRHVAAIADRGPTVAKIVADARIYNQSAGITGALISTRQCFAQLIEGPGAEIAGLMERIEHDRRHTEVTILRDATIAYRQISDWSLAYSGWATYVAKHVDELVGSDVATSNHRIEQLVTMLVLFAKVDALGKVHPH